MVDDQAAQVSETGQSTAEGGIDDIVARQEEMGQKEPPSPKDHEADE